MTGFGAADAAINGERVSVELRTVNHRFFNASFRLPGHFARWETDLRELLRRRIARGHVALSVRAAATTDGGGVSIDEARLAAYVKLMRSAKERFGLSGELDIATVLRLPDVLVTGTDELPPDSVGAELASVVERAADALTAMREAEGLRLAGFLGERLTIVEGALARLEARAPQRVTEAADHLREVVRTLVTGQRIASGGATPGAGSGVDDGALTVPRLDEGRLAQEIAILADRLDVAEELDRFRAHIAAFRAALAEGAPDGVGKRLGFLAQEMLREANTTGSKANDAAMSRDVIMIKEELERIREQVDNLE